MFGKSFYLFTSKYYNCYKCRSLGNISRLAQSVFPCIRLQHCCAVNYHLQVSQLPQTCPQVLIFYPQTTYTSSENCRMSDTTNIAQFPTIWIIYLMFPTKFYYAGSRLVNQIRILSKNTTQEQSHFHRTVEFGQVKICWMHFHLDRCVVGCSVSWRNVYNIFCRILPNLTKMSGKQKCCWNLGLLAAEPCSSNYSDPHCTAELRVFSVPYS